MGIQVRFSSWEGQIPEKCGCDIALTANRVGIKIESSTSIVMSRKEWAAVVKSFFITTMLGVIRRAKSAETTRFLEGHKIKLMNHPPFSPDLAPDDFYLFFKCEE
ncbi:hypothetical protein EVAR_44458_1 [Eumeta japonica]|uniref:Histone-lysine N-methyltransferase SETMAR n=1 Tax=Eumeta variegata TaxID=151549 RepID=A0A4C1WKC9_EUMVA|nr:hypothetical protein EVAR_44458_1 [Eumeta japonica]